MTEIQSKLLGGDATTLTSLAALYFPTRTKQAARRALSYWIRTQANLQFLLEQAGMKAYQKTLTPRQVAIIVEVLGEP